MTLQAIKTFMKNHRLAVLLTAAGIMVVTLVVAYVLWSASGWSQLEAATNSRRSSIKNDASSALSLAADTSEKREDKRKALKKLADKITAGQKDACQVHGLLQWQQDMPHAKPKLEDCRKKEAQLKSFEASLANVSSYLESEKQLSVAITNAGRIEKMADKDFAAQVTAWQAAEVAIGKITSGTPFDSVKAESVNVVKAITSAWQAVVAANDAKDKKKYEDAVAALASAYKGFEPLTTLSAQKFDPLARDLEEKYRLTFN